LVFPATALLVLEAVVLAAFLFCSFGHALPVVEAFVLEAASFLLSSQYLALQVVEAAFLFPFMFACFGEGYAGGGGRSSLAAGGGGRSYLAASVTALHALEAVVSVAAFLLGCSACFGDGYAGGGGRSYLAASATARCRYPHFFWVISFALATAMQVVEAVPLWLLRRRRCRWWRPWCWLWQNLGQRR